jgi:hypothetical protein
MSDLFSPQPDATSTAAMPAEATPTPTPTPTPTTTLTPADAVPDAEPRPQRPRVRSGAIAWGLIVSAAAVFLLVILTSPENSAAFGAWTSSLGWGGFTLAAVIAVGAFILIMAILSAIRGAQRRRSVR